MFFSIFFCHTSSFFKKKNKNKKKKQSQNNIMSTIKHPQIKQFRRCWRNVSIVSNFVRPVIVSFFLSARNTKTLWGGEMWYFSRLKKEHLCVKINHTFPRENTHRCPTLIQTHKKHSSGSETCCCVSNHHSGQCLTWLTALESAKYTFIRQSHFTTGELRTITYWKSFQTSLQFVWDEKMFQWESLDTGLDPGQFWYQGCWSSPHSGGLQRERSIGTVVLWPNVMFSLEDYTQNEY